ncbi:lactate utilization protein C [Parasediminibacterium paludis]|uniref:Lactate utilization protein C n=1 Tax=Parasediminibacterium paludis TaxID=908966 RepID=A0ABV8PZC8_9BACT
MTNSRENILNKIRQALVNPVPVPFAGGNTSDNVFLPSVQELEIEFAENFTKLLGKFSFCANLNEMASNLQILATARNWSHILCNEDNLKQQLSASGFTNFTATDLASCDAAITTCESLVARTGSMILSAAQQSGRSTSVYAPVHICIAYTSQLVYDIKDGLQLIKTKYGANLPSLITLATGPSRTADIEKTLVVGVHGPKEVFCFLIDG